MSKSNETTPNVPTLRFPNYSGEWQVSSMGKVCTFRKGYGISKENLSSDGTPCVLYGELYTTYKTAIAKRIKSKTSLDPTTLFHSKKNDVIIPCSGETAEDIATSVCIPYDDILLGGDLTVIRSDLDGAFLSNQINSVRKYDIARIAQGKSIVHLQADELKKIFIAYPTIEEQQKISGFIDKIDERIEVQNKIISDLKVLKKELMDYILNTCDFMELSIKDLIDCGFARIIKASEMKKFNGTRKYLSTSSIGENGIEQVESIITYTDRPSRASMLPIKGSIWFAKMKNSVKVYQSTDNDENHYILSTGFYGLLCDETKVNSRWIIELFKSDYFNTQKDKFSEGSSMSGIKDSQLADITLKVFADKKQEKYHTNNIQNLSKKIQLEKNALQVLLKQKQFFLNAMFI